MEDSIDDSLGLLYVNPNEVLPTWVHIHEVNGPTRECFEKNDLLKKS